MDMVFGIGLARLHARWNPEEGGVRQKYFALEGLKPGVCPKWYVWLSQGITRLKKKKKKKRGGERTEINWMWMK